MTLRQTTREIIKFVEEISGIPVQVTEDPNLQTIAAVRMARKGGLPQHLIVYKPEKGKAPDYEICFQCGYIIRLFQSAPENQFDLTDTQKGRDEIEDMLRAPDGAAGRFRLKKSQIVELRDQFHSGLLVHLRSVPIGFYVSRWLTTSYPEFAEMQMRHVQKESETNKQSLQANIQQITPPKVYNATLSISAAYAIFWADQYNKPEWVHPYHTKKFDITGHKLLDVYNKTPDDPNYDKTLIQSWGEHLSIQSWFELAPNQSGI